MTLNREAESAPVLVHVQIGSGVGRIPPRAELRRWVAAALDIRAEAEVTVRIVGDAESAELNRRYRGCEGATNVLSFPAADDWSELHGEPRSLGDVVVCAPVVERESREQGKPVQAHWAHILVHGALHLLGYDHENETQAREMERRERELLAGLGFPDPYAEPP
jgi:probable rRNA maturation factor